MKGNGKEEQEQMDQIGRIVRIRQEINEIHATEHSMNRKENKNFVFYYFSIIRRNLSNWSASDTYFLQ